LGIDDLVPADILLSRGNELVSDLIAEADRSSYSHAALWSGTQIIEATLDGGVSERPASGSRDVYRFVNSAGGAATGLTAAERAAVVEAARGQTNNRYDTAEIALLATVYNKWWGTRRPRRSLAASVLEVLGGPTAERVRAWLQAAYGRSAPRICSELVALAYYQAGRGLQVYALAKRPSVSSPANDETLDSVIARQAAELNVALYGMLYANEAATRGVASTLGVPSAEAKGLLFGDLAYDSETKAPIAVVTPGDLQFSPSLRFVGRVDFVEGSVA